MFKKESGPSWQGGTTLHLQTGSGASYKTLSPTPMAHVLQRFHNLLMQHQKLVIKYEAMGDICVQTMMSKCPVWGLYAMERDRVLLHEVSASS